MSNLVRVIGSLSLFTLVACGGATSGAIGSSGGSGTATVDPGGPQLVIQARGSSAPFVHDDGLAGETPTSEIFAIRDLHLAKSADDASPITVFDLGDKPIEAELASGATTGITQVALSTLAAGTYTIAKVGVTYVRYRVAATVHADDASFPGDLTTEQAMSDGAFLQGSVRKKGFFHSDFAAGATSYGTVQGDDAPTPIATTVGGIWMDTSGPETFYEFPVSITIDPSAASDHAALFEVNITDSFRWQDQPDAGYAAGVFDTTTSIYEPVAAFGANTFTLEGK